MSADTPRRDPRTVDQRVAAYQRDLAELRAAMDERAGMDPASAEFQAALQREEQLLDRIHTWSLASERDRPEAGASSRG